MLPCLSHRDRSGLIMHDILRQLTSSLLMKFVFDLVIIAVITLDDLCEVSFIDSHRCWTKQFDFHIWWHQFTKISSCTVQRQINVVLVNPRILNIQDVYVVATKYVQKINDHQHIYIFLNKQPHHSSPQPSRRVKC